MVSRPAPLRGPTSGDRMKIRAQVYESGLIRRGWRIRFVGGNNEKFGHLYDDPASAVEAVRKIVDPANPVQLEIVHRDGTVWKNLGVIR